MKFGLILPGMIGGPMGSGGAGDYYEETIKVCQEAESLGFDFAVISQHRFSPGYITAPFAVLAALAASTSTIRIGTYITLLPSYHPLEVAENLATIDRISGGRAFITGGVGYRDYEYTSLGLRFKDRGARMTEAMQILGLVWQQDSVSFDGEHFSFSDVSVYPTPIQYPRPPIWIGALAPAAVDRAARLADGWATDSKQTRVALQERVADFRSAAAACGRSPVICLSRDVGIASTRERVSQDWLPRAREVFRNYASAGLDWKADPVAARIVNGEEVGLAEFAEDRFIAGSPDDCVQQVKFWRDAIGCENMLVRLGYGEHFDYEAMRLFANEVIPGSTA